MNKALKIIGIFVLIVLGGAALSLYYAVPETTLVTNPIYQGF